MSPLNKEERERMQEYCRLLKTASGSPETLTHGERADITKMLNKVCIEGFEGENMTPETQARELMLDLNTIEALLQKEGLIEKDELIIDAEIKLLKTRYFIVLKLRHHNPFSASCQEIITCL